MLIKNMMAIETAAGTGIGSGLLVIWYQNDTDPNHCTGNQLLNTVDLSTNLVTEEGSLFISSS